MNFGLITFKAQCSQSSTETLWCMWIVLDATFVLKGLNSKHFPHCCVSKLAAVLKKILLFRREAYKKKGLNPSVMIHKKMKMSSTAMEEDLNYFAYCWNAFSFLKYMSFILMAPHPNKILLELLLRVLISWPSNNSKCFSKVQKKKTFN